MIFLNPAILFGLLAASIPVIIHLFNLRKLKKIEFSTLTFLKELQKNKIRKIKLKQWILLALRVFIKLLDPLFFPNCLYAIKKAMPSKNNAKPITI